MRISGKQVIRFATAAILFSVKKFSPNTCTLNFLFSVLDVLKPKGILLHGRRNVDMLIFHAAGASSLSVTTSPCAQSKTGFHAPQLKDLVHTQKGAGGFLVGTTL